MLRFLVNYRYLEAFLLVATHKNFSEAAKHLKIAQSAVSRQIQLLEESMNTQLIIRSTKKMILTDAGQNLYKATVQYYKQVESVRKTCKETLRIGTLHGFLEHYLISAMSEYLKKQSLDLYIDVNDNDVLFDKLQKNELDLVITQRHVQNDFISSLKLFDESLVLISSQKIDIKKIQNYRWVVYSENDFLFSAYKKIKPKATIQVNSMTAKKKFIAIVSDAIAVIPSHMLNKYDKLFTYQLNIQKKDSSTIYLSCHNLKTYPQYLQDLINILSNNQNPL